MKFIAKFSSLMSLMLAVLSGVALFWVSQQVQESERLQRRLDENITQEREALRVLHAEWDYLNRPDRLEELARTYLNMEPQKLESTVASVDAIPMPEETEMGEPMLASTTGETVKSLNQEPVKLQEQATPVLNESAPSSEENFNGVLDQAISNENNSESTGVGN